MLNITVYLDSSKGLHARLGSFIHRLSTAFKMATAEPTGVRRRPCRRPQPSPPYNHIAGVARSRALTCQCGTLTRTNMHYEAHMAGPAM